MGFAHCRWILALLYLSLPFSLTAADVTVDDTDPEIIYSPVTASWSQGSTCVGCLVQPDAAETHGGTWHDATQSVGESAITMTYTFTGTGVSLFCIIANTVQFASTSTNIVVTIDGAKAGAYTHDPSADTNFEYNVNVFSTTALSNGKHTVVLSAVGTTGKDSLVLFDYLTYVQAVVPPTTPVQPTTSKTTTSSATNPTTTSTSTSSSSTTSSSSSGSSSGTSTNSDSLRISTPTVIAATSTSSSTGGVANPNTATTNTTSSSSKSPIGAIVGGVIGGVAAIAVLIFLLFYCSKRQKRENIEPTVQPFSPDSFAPREYASTFISRIDPFLPSTATENPFANPMPTGSSAWTTNASGSNSWTPNRPDGSVSAYPDMSQRQAAPVMTPLPPPAISTAQVHNVTGFNPYSPNREAGALHLRTPSTSQSGSASAADGSRSGSDGNPGLMPSNFMLSHSDSNGNLVRNARSPTYGLYDNPYDGLAYDGDRRTDDGRSDSTTNPVSIPIAFVSPSEKNRSRQSELVRQVHVLQSALEQRPVIYTSAESGRDEVEQLRRELEEAKRAQQRLQWENTQFQDQPPPLYTQ